MFKVVQRYLAASFISSFVLSTLFFVIFLLIFQLFRLIRILISKELEFQLLAELVSHVAASFLPVVIPLAALFATVYTMNKLSENSEVIAMRSFGLRKNDLFAPFLILGILIAILVFAIGNNLAPYSKKIVRNTIRQVVSKAWLSSIESGQFFTEIPGVTIFSKEVVGKGRILKEVFIRVSKAGEEQIIVAKRGTLIKQTQDDPLSPQARIALIDGHIIKILGKKRIEKILFNEYDFPMFSGRGRAGFLVKDNMRSSRELDQLINHKKERLRKYFDKEKQNKKLSGFEKRKLRALLRSLSKSQLEFWSRWNAPFTVLVFIFLGFSLGIKKGRGRIKNSESIGLIIIISYYAIFFLGIALSKAGRCPPIISIFAPTLVLALIGFRFFRKIDWFS